MANPFLDRSFHIRWSQLTAEQAGPAIDHALAEAAQAIARIEALPLGQVDYAQTFLALENAPDLLNETWGKLTHLMSVADAPAWREVHHAWLPKVSAFYAEIPLRADLWLRLKAAAAQPAVVKLGGVHRRLVDETLADFRQQGADLSPEKKQRLAALQGELAQLTQKYSENVLDATNAWSLQIDDELRLAGLPVAAIAAAQQRARAKGADIEVAPRWLFTLQAPSQEPVMLYAEDATLRQQLWQAAAVVGAQAPHDNRELIKRILALRQEKASLLGRAHFADLVLARRMAKSGQQASDFIVNLHRRIAPAFVREASELQDFKAAQTQSAVAPLAPWEVTFWAEKLRRARYDFDEEQLRPYFPLPGVMAGLFEIVHRVFGVRVTGRPAGDVETWHAEVKFYDMHAASGIHVGSFYTDWHPRDAKRGGAWMNHLITGGPLADGTRVPHLGLMCGNLTPAIGEQPALLNHREVETIFHEFGHLLHHLLGEVEIKSLNGTNVAWDFVELPSQLMENWCWERAGLDLFARHFETSAPIPEELFQQMIAAKNFRSATATMRQLAFARLDLELHTRPEAPVASDWTALLGEALRDYLIVTEPRTPTIEHRFNHIFSDPVGYAAGYYSYKWAEVLDADAFTRFQREGVFNQKVGAEFVAKILSRGNAVDPMELFTAFMGRTPDQQALLNRAGLV